MAFTGPHGEPITITGSAPDVSGRPETSAITKVEFTPKSLFIRHTAEAWWPEPIPPDWTGGVQYTSWFVINCGGAWYTTGCLEYWKTPPDDPYSGSWKGGPDPAPFSDGMRNWWYHASPQNTRQPGVGETVGMFVTAGSQRMKDVVDPNCVERSNIVWVTVPPNDTGLYTFDSPPIPPEPIPPASGYTLDDVMEALAQLDVDQGNNTTQILAHTTSETDRVIQRLNELRQEVIDFAEIAGKMLFAKWLVERRDDEPPPV
jgi:hypothetical protein